MAGCRIGYVVGNPDVIHTLSVFKSHVDFGVFLPIQKAAIAALTSDYASLDTLVAEYTVRRDALCEGLTQAGWTVSKSPATMFVWAKIPDGWTSRKFAFDVLNHAGVAVTPGNAFGSHGEGYVRLALVQPPEVLRKAADRIEQFLHAREFARA
jgi:LL-diaminopimelate aminotransferase